MDPKLFLVTEFGNCLTGNVNGSVQRNGAGASQLLVTVTETGPFGIMPNSTITLRLSLNRANPDILQGTLQPPGGLFGNPGPEPVRFEGNVTGPDIQQEVYVYTWTDKLPKDTISGPTLKLGHLEVDSCQNLLLGSETAATASCKTHVKLTSAAAVIFGSKSTDQIMQASFGKQPNGTWVGTQVSYAPPPYNLDQ